MCDDSERGDRSLDEASQEALLSRANAGNDRLTMADAAKLKGVSYHTVSRAVRRGRLPVVRLGRMALISARDLQIWTPMKERAPHKYRRKSESYDGSTSVNLVAADHLTLAQRLATLYELIHMAASEGSLEELGQTATERIAEAFQLSRLTLWQVDTTNYTARRLAYVYERLSDMPDIVSLDRVPFFSDLVKDPSSRIIRDISTVMNPFHAEEFHVPDGPLIAIPLVWNERVVGLMYGDCLGREFDLNEEQLALADGVASQLAMAIDSAMLREAETRRSSLLGALLEELSSAVSAFDQNGFLTLTNECERKLFDLSEDDARIGQHMTEYLGKKRRENLDGTPVSIDDNPVTRALRGEILHGLRQVVIHENGERRFVTTNSRPITIDGHIVGAVSVSHDITPEREVELRNARYLDQMQLIARRSQSLADIVVEMNSELDSEAVTRSALRRVIDEFGAEKGALLLRDDRGRFVVSSAQNLESSPFPASGLDELAMPLADIAFGRNRPALLHGDVLIALRGEDFYSGAILVIPMQIRGHRVGVAYLLFPDVPEFDDDDLGFAAVWGRQCAQAIDRARLIDQLEYAHGRLMATIDQLPQSVLIIDYSSGEITMANKEARELWGTALEGDGIAASDLRLLDSEGVPFQKADHPFVRPLKSREESLGEPLTVVKPDGTEIEMLSLIHI